MTPRYLVIVLLVPLALVGCISAEGPEPAAPTISGPGKSTAILSSSVTATDEPTAVPTPTPPIPVPVLLEPIPTPTPIMTPPLATPIPQDMVEHPCDQMDPVDSYDIFQTQTSNHPEGGDRALLTYLEVSGRDYSGWTNLEGEDGPLSEFIRVGRVDYIREGSRDWEVSLTRLNGIKTYLIGVGDNKICP